MFVKNYTGLLAVTILFLLSACISSPETITTTFGKPISSVLPTGKLTLLHQSTLTLQTQTKTTFSQIQDFRRQLAVLEADPTEPLTTKSFQKEISINDQPLEADFRFRETALDALVKYTALLHAVTTGDIEGDIDRALEELAGALNALRQTGKPDTADARAVSTILGNAVHTTRVALSQKTRLDTLRSLMTLAQPDIQRLATLATRHNDTFADLVQSMTERMIALLDERRPLLDDYVDPALVSYDSHAAAMLAESKHIQDALLALQTAMPLVLTAHFSIRNLVGQPFGGSSPELQQLLQEVDRLPRDAASP